MTMLCRNPIIPPGMKIPVGCGQCGPCRAKRQMVWAHRIMLETLQWERNSFWSLSYRDEELSLSASQLPTLNRREYVLFLKRLRKSYEPLKFRFFIVGEYGPQKWRPHYHVILFNYPMCQRGLTLRDAVTRQPLPDRCCPVCQKLNEIWGMGHVFGGSVTMASARYCAKYTLKKMTMADDPRLIDRVPEFAQFSRMPGIGATAMWEVASTMLEHRSNAIDVPTHLCHGRGLFPLGRTLRGKLRERMGREDELPKEVLDRMEAEMFLVRQAAFNDSVPFKSVVREMNDGAYELWKAKQLIFAAKETL